MKRFGRLTALPAVLLVNLFIKLLWALLAFVFDDVPDFWHWAWTGEFEPF
jgi:hypothetical protein